MNTQIMAIFVLALTETCIGDDVWRFNYDENFVFTCSGSNFLTFVKSEHNNYYEDRKWEFRCEHTDFSNLMSYPDCNWSGYVNAFDEPVTFRCSNNGIIRGIESINDNHYEDRRWNYYCCKSTGYRVADCYLTSKLNEYDRPLEVSVPPGHVLRGVISIHNNYYEDRVFWFEFCRIEKA